VTNYPSVLYISTRSEEIFTETHEWKEHPPLAEGLALTRRLGR